MAEAQIQTECALFDAMVSDKAIIELSGTGDRFSTEFTGWERGRYIQVRLPAKLTSLDHVYPDKLVIVRYLRRGGEIHAFQSCILSVLHTPFRLIFLDYPRMVEKLPLRKMRRADCFIPASFAIAGCGVDGYLLNISHGGAKGSIPVERLTAPPKSGESLECRFHLRAASSAEISASAVIRRVEEAHGKCLLSLQFVNLDPACLGQLESYVSERLEYFGAGWSGVI